MTRETQDHYFREAKRQGYVSRAAYKLIEIDDRKKVLNAGDRVLDCGAAPGSWTQVVLQRIGRKGRVVAVDLQPMKLPDDPRLHTLQADLNDLSAEALVAAIPDAEAGDVFDVVLSDMAPNTTGDRLVDHYGSIRLCESVLDRLPGVLRPGGRLVMKAFEGQAYPELLERCRSMFEKVKGFRPKASRSESREMFIIAEGYRGG